MTTATSHALAEQATLTAAETAYAYLAGLPANALVALGGAVPFPEGFVSTVQQDRGERLEFAWVEVADRMHPVRKVRVTVLSLLSGHRRIAAVAPGWDGTFAPLSVR